MVTLTALLSVSYFEQEQEARQQEPEIVSITTLNNLVGGCPKMIAWGQEVSRRKRSIIKLGWSTSFSTLVEERLRREQTNFFPHS